MGKTIIILGIIAILLVAGGWAGASWFIGSAIEENHGEAFASANASLGGAFKIKRVKYERGFTSSTVTSRIEFPSEETSPEDTKIYLKSQILNGPVLFAPGGWKTGTTLTVTTLDHDAMRSHLAALNPTAWDTFNKAFNGEEPFTITTYTSFANEAVMTLFVSPFRHESDKDAEEKFFVDFSGMEGELRTDTEGSSATGNLDFGVVRLRNETTNSRVTLSGGEAVLDMRRIVDGLMLDGDWRITLPEITVRHEGENYDIRKTELVARSTEKAGVLNTQMTLSFDGMDGPPMEEGEDWPELFSAGGKFEAGAEGLHTKSLLAIKRHSSELQGQLASGDLSTLSPQEQEAFAAYLNAILDMFRPGLKVTYALTLGSGNDASETRFVLAFGGDRKLVETENLREVLNALSGDISLRVSMKLLPPEVADPLLASMDQMQIVQRTSSHYIARADLAGSKLRVNGEDFPIFDAFGQVLDQPMDWSEVQNFVKLAMPGAEPETVPFPNDVKTMPAPGAPADMPTPATAPEAPADTPMPVPEAPAEPAKPSAIPGVQ